MFEHMDPEFVTTLKWAAKWIVGVAFFLLVMNHYFPNQSALKVIVEKVGGA